VAEIYEIVLQGHLDARWAKRFEGMTLSHAEDGTTRLYGPVADQAALHARLTSIRDLGLTLVRVERASEAKNR
jgi:hypothetical protein